MDSIFVDNFAILLGAVVGPRWPRTGVPQAHVSHQPGHRYLETSVPDP